MKCKQGFKLSNQSDFAKQIFESTHSKLHKHNKKETNNKTRQYLILKMAGRFQLLWQKDLLALADNSLIIQLTRNNMSLRDDFGNNNPSIYFYNFQITLTGVRVILKIFEINLGTIIPKSPSNSCYYYYKDFNNSLRQSPSVITWKFHFSNLSIKIKLKVCTSKAANEDCS